MWQDYHLVALWLEELGADGEEEHGSLLGIVFEIGSVLMTGP